MGQIISTIPHGRANGANLPTPNGSSKKKYRMYHQIVAACIVTVGTIVVALVYTLVPRINQPSSTSGGSTSLNATPPVGFTVTSIHNGQVIQQSDLPLTIKGTYSSEGSSGSVWTILVDNRGQNYTQYPAVHLDSGVWTASNVQPLTGIVEIDFVFVDQAGATFLQNQGYGAFPTLPDNHKILAKVSINSKATMSV